MIGTDTFRVKLKGQFPPPLATDLNEAVYALLPGQQELQEAHPLVLAGLVYAEEDQVVTQARFGHLPARNLPVARLMLYGLFGAVIVPGN
jgi:hypothetical protein